MPSLTGWYVSESLTIINYAGVDQLVVCRTVDPKLFTNASNAGVAQLVEHQPSKLNVAGSSLVSRSTKEEVGLCSSEVEHFLGKEEVPG